jgi:gas vesicle protein
MGNKLKKQKKPIKSDESAYDDEINKGFEEAKGRLNNRLFWECEYANRHIHKFRLTDIDPLIDPLDHIYEKFFIRGRDYVEDSQEFKADMYSLIYAWHRSFVNDGFIDIYFERKLNSSRIILDLLTPDEVNIIKKIHELSHEYGILILELCRLPTIMDDVPAYLLNSGVKHNSFSEPLFLLPKKDEKIQGVEFSVIGYELKIKKKWDVVFYVNIDDKISHIKQKLKEVWDATTPKALGDINNYKIAFFIERNNCTTSYATNIIKTQIDAYKRYLNAPITPLLYCPENNPSRDMKDAIKKQKKSISSLTEQIKISGKQVNKNWSNEKGNIRRAVGLLLWDKIQNNVSSAAEEIEKLFDSQLPKELFEVYYSRYNTPNFSGLSSTKDIVIRELYADIKLTELCIKDAEFYSPYDIKKNKAYSTN